MNLPEREPGTTPHSHWLHTYPTLLSGPSQPSLCLDRNLCVCVFVHSKNADQLPRGCRVWRLVWPFVKLLPAATSLSHCCLCSSGSYCTTVCVCVSLPSVREHTQHEFSEKPHEAAAEQGLVEANRHRKVKIKLRKCISVSQPPVKTEVLVTLSKRFWITSIWRYAAVILMLRTHKNKTN